MNQHGLSTLAAPASGTTQRHPAEADNYGEVSARLVGAQALPELVRLSWEGNAALVRGDLLAYADLIPHSEAFLLMSPFGGVPKPGFDLSPEAVERTASFFRNGDFAQEVVQSVVTDDMVMLATLERVHAEIGGRPAQDWALRVTLVYRREDAGWRLVHRHADPLGLPISLDNAAALARGGFSG